MSELKSKFNNSRFAKTVKANKFPLVSGFAAGIIMLLVYAAFSMKPFGDITILRMDLYHQYGPLFAELYERIVKGMSLTYSWTSGLGSPFLGNYFNYLSSPLNFIMLIFGHKNMPEAIATMILLKAVFSAVFFSYCQEVSGQGQLCHRRLRRSLCLQRLFHSLLLECNVA